MKLLKFLWKRPTPSSSPLPAGVYVYWNEPSGLPNIRYFTDKQALGDHLLTLNARGVDWHTQEAA